MSCRHEGEMLFSVDRGHHTHTHSLRPALSQSGYTCTKVVFPDPAIPRQMIQVGLSAIGVLGALVVRTGSSLGTGLASIASAIGRQRALTHAQFVTED